MTDERLLNCANCDSSDSVEIQGDSTTETSLHRVTCARRHGGCGMTTPLCLTEEIAVRVWNTRPRPVERVSPNIAHPEVRPETLQTAIAIERIFENDHITGWRDSDYTPGWVGRHEMPNASPRVRLPEDEVAQTVPDHDPRRIIPPRTQFLGGIDTDGFNPGLFIHYDNLQAHELRARVELDHAIVDQDLCDSIGIVFAQTPEDRFMLELVGYDSDGNDLWYVEINPITLISAWNEGRPDFFQALHVGTRL